MTPEPSEQTPTHSTHSTNEMQPPHGQGQSDSDVSGRHDVCLQNRHSLDALKYPTASASYVSSEGLQAGPKVPGMKIFHENEGLPLITVNDEIAQPELDTLGAETPLPPAQLLQLEPDEYMRTDLPDAQVESNLESAEDSVGIIEPPLMFSESESELEAPPVSLRVQSNSVSEVTLPECDATEEEESLFNELMDSSSGIIIPQEDVSGKLPPVCRSKRSTLSRGDAEVLKSLLNQATSLDSDEEESPLNDSEALLPPREFSSPDLQDDTPMPSPFSVRRCTAEQNDSPVEPENEDSSTTPKASPSIQRHTTPSTRGQSSASSAEDIHTIIEPPSPFSRSSSVGSLNASSEVHILPAPLQFSEEPNTVVLSQEESKGKALSVTSSLIRRHSYSSEHKRKILVAKDGTRSTGTSPSASPDVGNKKHGGVSHSPKASTLSVLQRRGSFSHDLPPQQLPISMVGLVSTTRNDHSLEDIPSICPQLSPSEVSVQAVQEQPGPVVHVANQSRPISPRNSPTAKAKLSTTNGKGEHLSSREKKDHSSPRSLFRLYRQKKSSKSSLASSESSVKETESESPFPVVAPYEGNPEERLSFDEILASFDEYASATGKTTKTKPRLHPPSPDLSTKPKKEKKRRRRSNTVANVDASTMKLVRASLAAQDEDQPSPQPKHGTVQHLAREYSRLIQEKQRSRVAIRRHATIVENPRLGPNTEHVPDWLQQLRQRRSQSSQEEATPLPPVPKVEEAYFLPTVQGQSRASYESPEVEKSKVSIKTKSFTLPKNSTDEPASNVLTPSRATLPTRSPRLPRLLQRSRNEDVFSNFDAVSEPGDEYFERKGRFRGWVKSLVDRFSGAPKEK